MLLMKKKLLQAEVLQEKYDPPESIMDGSFTKTAQFMAPAIGLNIANRIVFSYFENCFLGDKEHSHNYTRPIFCLFSIENFEEYQWKKLYNTLIKAPNFLTEYDVGVKDDKYLLMLVFSVPEIYKEDYINFRNGRYSLFSGEYKKKFPKYIDEKKTKLNNHWQVINKDPILKRELEEDFMLSSNFLDDADEIWDAPRVDREYYRYKTK